jgi:hypothetical protein
VSEKEQAPGTALLKLFDDAVEAYEDILHLASATGLGDGERTAIDLATRIAAAKDSIVWRAESVANIYLISSAVAGERPDKRKVRRLLYLARRIEAMAERIDKEGRRGDVDLMFRYDKVAESYMKGLLDRGEDLRTFYKKARALVSETAKLSQELLSEASNNLVTIGVLPRKRILEQFEEGLRESFTNEGELSEAIDNDKRGEGN